MKTKELTIATATIGLVVYTFALSAMASMQSTQTISNTGSVRGIGVGVYWDAECTNPVASIAWGLLNAGSSKNVTCYIRNEGNVPQTLSLYTSNWSPANASNYISLSWDYGGQLVDVDEVIQATLTLSVASTVEGMMNFSFDITLEGSG